MVFILNISFSPYFGSLKAYISKDRLTELNDISVFSIWYVLPICFYKRLKFIIPQEKSEDLFLYKHF